MEVGLNDTSLPLAQCPLHRDLNMTGVCSPTLEEAVNNTLMPEVNEGPILKDQNGVIITCVFVGFVWLIGVFGNAAVIMIYRKKYDRFSSHLFLLALGVNDFVACFFLLPQTLFMYVISKNAIHSTCMGRLIFLVILTSVLLLTGMTIDRTIAIRNPLNFDSANKRVKGIIMGGILLAILVTLFSTIDMWVGIIMGTTTIILSLLVILCMYIAIPFYVLGHWRSSRSTIHPAPESPAVMNQLSPSQSQQCRREPLPSTSGIGLTGLVSKGTSPTTGLQNISNRSMATHGADNTQDDRRDDGSHIKDLNIEKTKMRTLQVAQIGGTAEPDIKLVEIKVQSGNTNALAHSHEVSGMNSIVPQIRLTSPSTASLSQLEVTMSPNNLLLQHQLQKQKLRRHLLKTISLLFSISLVYIVSYLPTLMSVFGVFDIPVYFRNTYYISHAANPIIYSFTNKEFRKYLVGLRRRTATFCRGWL